MPNNRHLLNTLLSAGFSLLLLGLLLSAVSGSAEESVRPRLFAILADTSLRCIGLYLLASLGQSFFRLLRSRLLLARTIRSGAVPGLFRLLLVTLSRNLFAALLPARLGELSFAALLHFGCKVGADASLASMAAACLADLTVLALLLLGVIGWQLLAAEFQLQSWLIGAFLVTATASVAVLLVFGPLLRRVSRRLGQLRPPGRLDSLVQLTGGTAASWKQAWQAGIAGRVLGLSLAVQALNCLGLHLLFLGVALPSFPDAATLLTVLASAETGSASELTAAGAVKAVPAVIISALLLWRQAVDCALGIAAMTLFLFTAGRTDGTAPARNGKRGLPLLAGTVFAAGLAVFALQIWQAGKLGAFLPPKPGEPAPAAAEERQGDPLLARLRGFVIWSSNRFGNHDLVMLTLPERRLTRLTSDPHAEYFPRISPDGAKVVFCRSQEPWVSQRNKYAWDTWLLDLTTRETSLLAKNANVPTWSADGRKVYFQRRANQFVEYVLATKKETVVFETGKNLPLPAAAQLGIPAWSEARQSLAVTIRRGGPVYVFVIGPDKMVRKIGEGCELNWAPDSSFLYHVGHSGNGGTAFYKINPDTLEPQLWFDAPGAYSHEYFPKLANTGKVLVYGASTGGHEHDTADYEIFLWPVGSPMSDTARLSFHTGNDNWPDVFLY